MFINQTKASTWQTSECRSPTPSQLLLNERRSTQNRLFIRGTTTPDPAAPPPHLTTTHSVRLGLICSHLSMRLAVEGGRHETKYASWLLGIDKESRVRLFGMSGLLTVAGPTGSPRPPVLCSFSISGSAICTVLHLRHCLCYCSTEMLKLDPRVGD